MKAILIFDNSDFCGGLPGKTEHKKLDIFPLTGNWDDIYSVIGKLQGLNIDVQLVDSGQLVNNESVTYRDSFIEWAAALGNIKIGLDTLRSLFRLPDQRISAWWFSLLSDKDPAKHKVFSRISQASAILKYINSQNIDTVILTVKDGIFKKGLESIFRNRRISCSFLKIKGVNYSFLRIIKDRLLSIGIFILAPMLKQTLADFIYVKSMLPSFKKRKKIFENALLFFSYFPSILKEDAYHSIFSNKFALPLQELCRRNNKPIVWVLMYADFEGASFGDAITLAERFIKNGEDIFYNLEFLNFNSILKAVRLHLRLLRIWGKTKRHLDYKKIEEITGNDFSAPFLLDAIDNSFRGNLMFNGIINYEIFKNIFRNLRGFSHAIYSLEMMSWEYALVAAKKACSVSFPLIGYQDFAFSPYYLQMFHSAQELRDKNATDGIPVPEVIAGCGRTPQIMLEKYYGKVENLETLRHLRMRELLQSNKDAPATEGNRKFILLVCTNIDLDESKNLASLVKAAYPGIKENFEIWFKGHPCLSAMRVLNEVGINTGMLGYKIKEGAPADLLSQCDAVLVGASSVVIYALAFTCSVLIYVNPGRINQSPLIGFDEFYHKVSGPDDMRSVLGKVKSGAKVCNIERRREFIREYWNLNSSLDGWKKALNLN